MTVDSSRIESLFDVPVFAAELSGPGDPETLFPEERKDQQRWVAKRVSEFAAGRQCAHRALRRLGMAPEPLLPQPDRRPAWPAGAVGSITHCIGFAAAVVALETSVRSVGLDAEPEDAVAPQLWPRILNPDERNWVQSRSESEQCLWATVVFSAKEAFYKCQYGVTGRWLGFSDAQVDVLMGAEPGVFSLVTRSKGILLHGRGFNSGGIVCTAFEWPLAVDNQ